MFADENYEKKYRRERYIEKTKNMHHHACYGIFLTVFAFTVLNGAPVYRSNPHFAAFFI
jgi:hypothetical protein